MKERATVDVVREYLTYERDAGVFRWRKVNSNRVRVGARAGSFNASGYVVIRLHSVDYYAHHLVWLFEKGSWPTKEIDHVNGNTSDNRVSNLREATPSEQKFNQRRRVDNRSGVRGVWFSRQAGKWVAEIKAHGKRRHVGFFDCLAQAARARRAAEANFFGEFARKT